MVRVIRENDRGARPGEATTWADIRAPRELIWELISDVKYITAFQPEVIRAFRLDGTPKGPGEMMLLIFSQNGKERTQTILTVDEVAPAYAVTRVVGEENSGVETVHRLTSMSNGTRFEVTFKYTIPGQHRHYGPGYELHYKKAADAYLQRVKVIAENRWAVIQDDTEADESGTATGK